VQYSSPHTDLTHRGNCKRAALEMQNYHNKRAKSQIFVDISQEGVNHGNICVM
jgi:hypothetical protein